MDESRIGGRKGGKYGYPDIPYISHMEEIKEMEELDEPLRWNSSFISEFLH